MIFAVLVYFMLFWGNAGDTPGSKLFYIYMEGYKALFVEPKICWKLPSFQEKLKPASLFYPSGD